MEVEYLNETMIRDQFLENATILDCPKYSKEDLAMVDFFTFWIEGVANVAVASLGLLANLVSSFILSK